MLRQSRYSMLMRTLLTAFALLCLLCTTTASAALHIDITKGIDSALPIAIVPFGHDGNGSSPPVDVAKIVSRDLRNTGLFKPLPRKQMLAKPTQMQDVHYANWRTVEVDDLVIGSVHHTADGGYSVDFHILDVDGGHELTSYHLQAAPHGLETTAHSVANLIYQAFIGSKGYFLSRIAYVTATGTGESIHYRLTVSDYDGRHPQTVLTANGPIMSPAWSPDGKKLAYVVFDVRAGTNKVVIRNLATGKMTTVSSRRGINSAPAWSPNGKKLAVSLSYGGHPNIYLYNVATHSLHQLTHGRAIDTEPSWSADGKSLVFTSDRGGRPQIYRMRASGGQVERLTFSGKNNQCAVYSPNGSRLAMVQNGPSGFRIAVMNLASNNVRVIGEGPLDECPSFSPNGKAIIYTNAQGLTLVSLNGKVHAQLQGGSGAHSPAWSPANY